MRLMRFAAQLNLELNRTHCLQQRPMTSRLSIVSQERISDEFMKIMACPQPSIGLALCRKTGAWKKIFPELAQMEGIEHEKSIIQRRFSPYAAGVDKTAAASDNLWLRMRLSARHRQAEDKGF